MEPRNLDSTLPRRTGSGRTAPRRALAAAVWALTACAGGAGTGGGGDAGLPPADPAELFFAPQLRIDLAEFERTRSGLYVQDLEPGAGPVVRRDSRVWIEYVGRLPDGTVFDAAPEGDPFHVRLGGSEVIRGWSEGLVGMRRGAERRLVVPPGLAYGSRARGRIPAGSTLVFHVRVVDVG